MTLELRIYSIIDVDIGGMSSSSDIWTLYILCNSKQYENKVILPTYDATVLRYNI